ncbi:MAG: LPS export ABC transporter permease LptF [Alphaproteobacteria bacterium]|nr:LPS export ABC transporter permease LptF [Alphaproteobacteria bacterium]
MGGLSQYLTGLNRYILRQCLSVMLFVTGALTAAVWLAQSLRLVDLIVNRGLSAEMFLYLALLIMPRFLEIVLPIGAFIAVLFVFNRLTTESELVVMRAAGVSPLSLAKPVLELAAIAFAMLMVLSLYLLPAANREFKDLLFEIRNRFVSSLLQEGSFTTISEKLTIYIGNRNDRGEVIGLLIDDERDRRRPVTILAQRGAFADTGGATRIIMVNGNRQQYDRETGKLSVLTFDRYVLDLGMLRDPPEGRVPEAQERFLGELLFPSEGIDEGTREAFLVEANERFTVPLCAFSFAILPLACLLPGEFNRRGQLKRVLLAVGAALAFETADLAVKNLEGRYPAAVPLSYLVALLPFALALGVLAHRGIGFSLRRPALAVAVR